MIGMVVQGAPTISKKLVLTKKGEGATITFAVSEKTDIEVAILNSKDKVVRHLAAGALGGKKLPPAPLKAGLSQTLEWDGKDDYGQAVKGAPFKVRVRVGMEAKLKTIVGGDPYAYYSKEMGQGDHSTWCITGVDAKSDGMVYVMGNSCNIGPPTIRQYDPEGNYLKTVFPPPAGLPIDKLNGWGVIKKKDDTYMFEYKDINGPKLSKTLICGKRAWIANLVPCSAPDKLLLSNGYRLMTINTDGTIPNDAMSAGHLVNKPSLFHPEKNVYKIPWKIFGPAFVSPSSGGKHYFLSGIFAGTIKKNRCVGAETTGTWRDGQLFKIDTATREAKVFFALPEKDVIGPRDARGKSPINDTRTYPNAAFHGVVEDAVGNVFLCDRQNKRIVILDKNAKIIREIPVDNPDAIALNPKTKALYITTRFGNYHRKGQLALLKFNDWSVDNKPSVTLPLGKIGTYPQPSSLSVVSSKGKVFVWVAYTTIPVRVYEDGKTGLKLVKDFYEAGPQRCLDVQHMTVDPKTETVYFADSFKRAFMIKDWDNPKFEQCMTDEKTGLVALSIAIDYRNRYLFTHDYIRGKVKYSLSRYNMDGKYITPAPIGSTGNHAISGQRVSNDWRIGHAMSQRGIAIAPDGGIAALGSTKHTDYSGPLYFFKQNSSTIPWEPVHFKFFGERPISGGIRFDPAGNMYVGKLPRSKGVGKIYKINPTGSIKKGCLYPTSPEKVSKVYDIDYGYHTKSFTRTPRFGVDGYGRIYYPTSLVPKVSVIDNQGNPILSFGTYGNRDSMGGLEGDKVPTKGVPMIWPNSVDATDDFIYVSDMVNLRLLRLAKIFAATETKNIE